MKSVSVSVEVNVHPRQECFTHYDGENDIYRTFLIGTMNEFVKKYPTAPGLFPTKINLEKETVDHIKKNMGIEQDRIDRLADPYLSAPALAIMWGDKPKEGCTIIDGNHRAVKLFEGGAFEMNAFIFRPWLWGQFILPPEAQKRFLSIDGDFMTRRSGILEMEKGQR